MTDNITTVDVTNHEELLTAYKKLNESYIILQAENANLKNKLALTELAFARADRQLRFHLISHSIFDND